MDIKTSSGFRSSPFSKSGHFGKRKIPEDPVFIVKPCLKPQFNAHYHPSHTYIQGPNMVYLMHLASFHDKLNPKTFYINSIERSMVQMYLTFS